MVEEGDEVLVEDDEEPAPEELEVLLMEDEDVELVDEAVDDEVDNIEALSLFEDGTEACTILGVT